MTAEQLARLSRWIRFFQTIRALLFISSILAIIYALTGNGFAPVLEILLLTILVAIPLFFLQRWYDRAGNQQSR